MPLSPRKCEAFFFSVKVHQAKLHRHLLLFSSPLRFNYTPIFLGSLLIEPFPFLNMHLRRRPSSSLDSRSFAGLLVLQRAPTRSPLLFTKFSFGPFSLMGYPDDCHYLALTTLPSWKAFTEQQSRRQRLPLFPPIQTLL